MELVYFVDEPEVHCLRVHSVLKEKIDVFAELQSALLEGEFQPDGFLGLEFNLNLALGGKGQVFWVDLHLGHRETHFLFLLN